MSKRIVGIEPCGCVAGLYIEGGIPKKVAADWVRGWIAKGCTVRPMTADEVAALPFRCESHPKPAQNEPTAG
jgi:hypothetical protein